MDTIWLMNEYLIKRRKNWVATRLWSLGQQQNDGRVSWMLHILSMPMDRWIFLAPPFAFSSKIQSIFHTWPSHSHAFRFVFFTAQRNSRCRKRAASYNFDNCLTSIFQFKRVSLRVSFLCIFWVLRAMWWRNKMWERNFSQANARPLLLLSCETFTLLEHTKSVCDELVKKYLRSSREPSRVKLQQSKPIDITRRFREHEKIDRKTFITRSRCCLAMSFFSAPETFLTHNKNIKDFLSSIFIWTLPRRAHNRGVVWTAFCSEARKTVKKHKNWKFPSSHSFS